MEAVARVSKATRFLRQLEGPQRQLEGILGGQRIKLEWADSRLKRVNSRLKRAYMRLRQADSWLKRADSRLKGAKLRLKEAD